MNELTALQSASLADDVYALTRFINQDDAVSFEFIQRIFTHLSRQINTYIQRVLDNILVNGRAS